MAVPQKTPREQMLSAVIFLVLLGIAVFSFALCLFAAGNLWPRDMSFGDNSHRMRDWLWMIIVGTFSLIVSHSLHTFLERMAGKWFPFYSSGEKRQQATKDKS